MEITEIVAAGPDFDRWYEVYRVSEEHGRPYARPWLRHELLEQVTSTSGGDQLRIFLGVLEGVAVVAGAIEYSGVDNFESAGVEVQVLPERRRQGLGSAMLERLLVVVGEMGREIVTAETSYPYDAPRDGSGFPGPEFLRARGFAFGIDEVQRVLDVNAARLLIDDLLAEAAPAHRDYRLVPFAGAVPEEFAVSYAALVATLSTEVPTGEMTVQQRSAEVEVLRAGEELLRRQGRTSIRTVALDGHGLVAGYTSIVVPSQEPEVAYQWGTLVAPEHRGHRLGLALKAANLQLLVRETPAVETLVTYNAQVNDHMVGINDRLGFRPVERLGEFERGL